MARLGQVEAFHQTLAFLRELEEHVCLCCGLAVQHNLIELGLELVGTAYDIDALVVQLAVE